MSKARNTSMIVSAGMATCLPFQSQNSWAMPNRSAEEGESGEHVHHYGNLSES